MNILIIGVGHHARRIYIPALSNNSESCLYGLDLLTQKSNIDDFLLKSKSSVLMYYTNDDSCEDVSGELLSILESIISTNKIDAVIISTDPLSHFKYAKWALGKGLHILMDKPITSEKDVCVDLKKAKKLVSDYNKLERIYKKFKLKKHLVFSLMSQRRYHPLYKKMKEKLLEVFAATNCPVTSIQTSHCDGQWRMPNEIIDESYHGYNMGYGKCSHTGYHSIDMVNWLVSATESREKSITKAEVFTSFTKPTDFMYQLNFGDYKNIFPDFNSVNKYSEKEYLHRTKHFGEIDAFSNIVFFSGKNIQTLGSLNLIHNGFSQRGWLSSKGRDLYKGNGRIRQEQYFIEQGPFQSMSLITYQSSEIGKETNSADVFSIGKEFHLELHVFRNSTLFPKWKTHETFNMKDFSEMRMTGYSRGHQEDARYAGIVDFLSAIKDKRDSQSDFLDHRRGTILLSAIYQSAIKRDLVKNPLIKVNF